MVKKIFVEVFILLIAALALLLFSQQPSAAHPPTSQPTPTPQPIKSAPLQSNRLNAVWGSSGSDIFAVGERGTILHYNGNDWSAMNSGTVNEIVAVWGASDSDVFAVGWGGMILHYDGTAWSPVNSGTPQDLNGVWGSSGGDVYVVGEGALILHYDGSAWSVMNDGTADYDLLSVWGSSDGDIFASGSLGKIWHYDGSAWSPLSTGSAYNHDLWVVWGSSGRDVFTVGYDGMILHYDGSAWSPMDSGTTNELIGIWGSSDHDVFAAGSGGTILHYDGTAWSPMNSDTTNYFTSVWGSSDSDVFAVGYKGTILHYDGQAWSDMSSGALAAPKYAARGAYAVGTQDFVVEDGDHTVTIAVWYPAVNPNHAPEEISYRISDQHPYLANQIVKGQALQNAAPDTTHGPYPLVIFSSGQFGWRQYSAYFVEHLASHGFVVMASDPREETMYTFWAGAANRPLDNKLTISFADKATAPGGALDGLIDTKHIGIAGHSSGGWTALVGGGAQFNLDKCAAYLGEDCLEFVPHAQEIAALLGLKTIPTGLWPPLNDPRVGAIIALAPNGDIWGADYEGVAVVKVPALIMNGTKDTIVPPERAAYPIYQHLGSTQKGLIKLINADHEIFSDSCDTGIPWCARESDAHEHNLINHFATAFLLTELKGDQEAAKALLPENASFPSIEYETTGFRAAEATTVATVTPPFTPTVTLDSALVSKIEAAITQTMKMHQLPGLAIGIIKDGQVAYTKGFGLAEVDTDRLVTPETVFQLASNSKTVVVTAIMQLKEQGKIDLDAPVTTYLPYFQLADERYKEITIRQLLSHRSGLPYNTGMGYYWYDSDYQSPEYDEGSLERHVRSLTQLKLMHAPGSKYGYYSDLGFEILGDVIAKVSGQSFEDYTQEHIFAPLGMQHTSFMVRDIPPELLAAPHVQQGAQTGVNSFFPYSRQHAPSSHLFSNVADMNRFALAQLNRGQLGEVRILPAAAYEEMWGTTYEYNLPSPPEKGYGLGWGIGELAGHRMIDHGGLDIGFHSEFLLAPDDGLSVIIMSNRDYDSWDLQNQVMKWLLEAEG